MQKEEGVFLAAHLAERGDVLVSSGVSGPPVDAHAAPPPPVPADPSPWHM